MGISTSKIIEINKFQMGNKQPLKINNNIELKNYSYSLINDFSLNLKKYYKNQIPPNEDDETPFIDKLFPPNNKSIFGSEPQKLINKKTKYLNINTNEIIWLKPNEIFNNQPYSIFEHEISISDINQGKIGDCYFLSAIISMVKYPQMIYQLFKTIKIPKNNCYQITMKINGEWKIIIIDDYFPCNKKNNFPIFCKPNRNEIWCLLLEKVWAKINNGYINIDSGYSNDAFNSLTNFVSEIYYHKDLNNENEIWNLIRKNDLKNNFLTCVTKKNLDIENYGIIPSHSCSIIKSSEKIIKGKKIKLIQIRNPWGEKEWKGKYSQLYLENNLDLMKYFQNEKKGNGIFWITFNDYIKFFDKIEICYYKKCICVKNIIIEKNRVKLPNIFHLVIYKKCNVDINIIRKSHRFNKQILINEKCICNLILIKIDENFSIINTKSSNNSSCFISQNLEKGEYLIYFFVDFNHGIYDKIRKISLNIGSDEFFDLYDNYTDNNFSFLIHFIEKYNLNLIKNQLFYDDNIIKNICLYFKDTTFSYFFLNNLNEQCYQFNINLKLINLYNIANSFGNCFSEINKNINIVLSKNQNLILLFNVKDFHKEKEIKIELEKIDIKEKTILKTNNKSLKISKIFSKEKKIENYNYIYNSLNFDCSNFIIAINHEELSQNYLLKKYPNEMSLILKLSPLKDNINVIFTDKKFKGEDYYLGEINFIKRKRHGRGIYHWEKDNLNFIGYSINGKFNGPGKFIFDDGTIHEGIFNNGILKGQGRIIFKNGKIKNVLFPLSEEN